MLLMTLKEVAKFLRVSPQTVYKMAQTGGLPAIKIGRQWRFRRDEIFNWLVKQTATKQRIKSAQKGK